MPRSLGPKQLTHSEPPHDRPLLVYDADCHFCIRWVRRWLQVTEGKIDAASYQSLGDRFTQDIPVESFQAAVRLIETDGQVFAGAEAVFRTLSYRAGFGSGLPLWCFQQIPGCRPIFSSIYRWIAKHRTFASVFTTLLWGKGEDAVCIPTYYSARDWFLRLLGVIYLIAFLSFWVQVDGLIGSNGILPVARWLTAIRAQVGPDAYRILPTLCWFNSSDSFLHSLCAAGVFLSALLIFQILPTLSLALLWVCYLSLAVAGQVFLNFQWDYLLLETGFFSIFLAPLRILPSARRVAPVQPLARFLLVLLLFRLMVMSGIVKLTSGDESWLNLTALSYHYETQPLPTPLAWWARWLPDSFHAASIVVMFAIEIGAPFLLFAPRRLRLFGAMSLIGFQILIALTGNYCFFNLLTIALCLLAIDDAVWPRSHKRDSADVRGKLWPDWILVPVTTVVFTFSGMLFWEALSPRNEWPSLLAIPYSHIESFRSLNGYGLFRVMTKRRPEIVVEGSADGETWVAYEFKYKPGDPNRPPPIVAPHQPRVDWQMWFAALDDVRREPWFLNFMTRLLENSKPVVSLLAKNPFPDAPPRYVRARLYQYRFSSESERKQTGAWWVREETEMYCPPVSLKEAQ